METVIMLSVMGVLLVGCWHVGNVFQKHWKQLETDPEMGIDFWTYFSKRSVRTYSNSLLPGRMSKTGQGVAPDQSQDSGDY